MHPLQQKLLRLVDTYALGTMVLREIANIVGEGHPQTIKHHLEALEKKGYIDWDRENKVLKRCSPGTSTNVDFIVIPVLGAANCGPATIYADENVVDHIKVSISLVKNCRRAFAVKAVGSSMNLANIDGKGIDDGDLVIIDPQDKDIKSNDYVLSIIDEVANIKRLIIDHVHEQITLMSESTRRFAPIYLSSDEANRFIVSGKVIQVIKSSHFQKSETEH